MDIADIEKHIVNITTEQRITKWKDGNMKSDPIFAFSAHLKNKFAGVSLRIFRVIAKLKRVSRGLGNKDLDNAIEDLMKVDQKIPQIFSRTNRFLGRLQLKRQRKKIR